MKELLKDRVVLIAGAGPGLGRSFALACAREGAKVALIARKDSTVDPVLAEVKAAGGDAMKITANLIKPEESIRAVEEAAAHFGRVDGLVVVTAREADSKTLEEQPDDLSLWRYIVEFNVFLNMQLIRAVTPHMKKAGGGSVVIINSTASNYPFPKLTPYNAAKSALVAAGQTLAKELGPYKIRVNNMHPGSIDNEPMQAELRRQAEREGTTYDVVRGRMEGENALRHITTPDEYAGTVLFLLSDMSSAITGESIHVNGGWHMFG